MKTQKIKSYCANCAKAYKTEKLNFNIFCSKACKKEYLEKENKFKRICLGCGDTFSTPYQNQKICNKCTYIEKECPECKELFFTHHSQRHMKVSQFCSIVCERKSINRKIEKQCSKCDMLFQAKTAKVTVCDACSHIKNICANCNEEFFSELEEGKVVYCSDECKENSEKRSYNKVCESCGSQFLGKASRSPLCDECFYTLKTCQRCSQKFAVPKRREDRVIYCGYYCRSKATIQTMKENEQGVFNDEIMARMQGLPVDWYSMNKLEKIDELKKQLVNENNQRKKYYIENAIASLYLKEEEIYEKLVSVNIEEEIKNANRTDGWIYAHMHNAPYISQ